ncbi:pilin protein%2C major subunit [Yersinia frederiksenii]|uniref:hypothetical protein n=1 Tax=Yersinia frederiksenii TaxID=29484 RepID=UPI0005DD40C9|nr:hypothetical protein [Yersinia frederiksenii]CFQ98258.1 pilin protein%2C major subunit [Yersinia frederiksenii]
MMISIAQGCVTVQRKTQEFLKNQRGSIIEYVMIIALAGIFIGLVKSPLTTMVSNTMTAAQTAISTGTADNTDK